MRRGRGCPGTPGAERLRLSRHDVDRRVRDCVSRDQELDNPLAAQTLEPEPAVAVGRDSRRKGVGNLHISTEVLVGDPRRFPFLDPVDPGGQVACFRAVERH